MRLTRVEIEGYRSISQKVDLHLDRDVTVLLGANDHGKTNILDALKHLNTEEAFNSESDLNWDRSQDPENFPCIVFHFEIEPSERETLVSLAEAARQEVAKAEQAKQLEAAGVPANPQEGERPKSDSAINTPAIVHQEPVALVPKVVIEPIRSMIRVERRGLAGQLRYLADGFTDSLAEVFASGLVPRVEKIRPQEKVPDAVSVVDLKSEPHEFMRGIFYYAGLNPDESASLFDQTDATMMRLKQASLKLNDTLKADWSQGRDLRYELGHESKADQILLRIEDPAVTSRLVRASHRSSGFTHFFALKTVLHARERDRKANSYIFLFDEPGIYLHPSGQYDLQQVLNEIGKHNQVIYSTHSLFMINKTFPARYRLIIKTSKGTTVDGKPFIGRWGPAIEALGLSLAGTIMFAQYVLLTEGDADPMLTEFLFQKLSEWGKASLDLNAFSVISTGDSRNTDALIRILKEGASAPKLLVLVDGDKGGANRLKKVKPLLDGLQVRSISLDEGLTTEDYMPGAGQFYVDAAARYVGGLVKTLGSGPTRAATETAIKDAATEANFAANTPTKGVAEWIISKGKEVGKLKTKPSKIGIAREYIDLVASETFSDDQLERAIKLLKQVQTELGIPELSEPEKKVTAD